MELIERPMVIFKWASLREFKEEDVKYFFLWEIWLIRYLHPLNCTGSGDWLYLEQLKEVLRPWKQSQIHSLIAPWRCNSGYLTTRHFADQVNPTPCLSFQNIFHDDWPESLLKYWGKYGFHQPQKFNQAWIYFK